MLVEWALVPCHRSPIHSTKITQGGRVIGCKWWDIGKKRCVSSFWFWLNGGEGRRRGRVGGGVMGICFFQFGDQLLPLYTTTTCTLRGGGAWFEIHLLFFQTCPSCYLSVSVWVWPQEHNLGSGPCHYWSWMTVAAQERTQVSFYHYQGCLLVLYVCLLSCFSTTHNDHEVETMS